MGAEPTRAIIPPSAMVVKEIGTHSLPILIEDEKNPVIVERTEIIPPIGPISIEVDETKPIIVERTEMIPPPSVPIFN